MSLTARMLRRPGIGVALVLLSACTDRSALTLTEPEPHFALGPKGTRTVTSLDDPGTGLCRAEYCTLRQAIEIASPGDRIVFKTNLTGRIVLTAGQLEIDEDVTIEGGGRITVDANSASRVIEITDDRTVTLEGLSITGGQVGSPISPVNGGGIRTQSNVTLTLRNTTIAGNSANFGGGIVFSDGELTIINSTIRENRASHQGGGIYNAVGLVSLVGSTVSENESGGQGGGLFNFGNVNVHGTMTVVNSTISGNRSGSWGGGIMNATDAVLTVHHSTITANHADAAPGIGTFGSVELTNTIVVGSSFGDQAELGLDCVFFGFGFFSSGGHNLIPPSARPAATRRATSLSRIRQSFPAFWWGPWLITAARHGRTR